MRLLSRAYILLVLLGTAWSWASSPGWPPAAWLAPRLGLGLLLATIGVVLALRWLNPPITAFMLQTRAELRRAGLPAELEWHWAGQAELAPALKLAAIAGEDFYFAFHAGFEWGRLWAAMVHNLTTGGKLGGSTITQQVAKNLFLWEGQSYLRKAVEAYFAALIEAVWPKRRILEVYLNIAQFGQRTFGAQAAAQRFFGKAACDLTPDEAALLVAVLPSPRRRRVEDPSHLVRLRQAEILSNMKRLGDAQHAQVNAPPPRDTTWRARGARQLLDIFRKQ